MNTNLKLFYTILIILTFSSIFGCAEYENTKPSSYSLQSFDKKHNLLISKFFSSIVRQIGIDSSYNIEYRPKEKDFYFNHIDSTGNGNGYFEPVFNVDKDEEQFLMENSVGDIFYYKKCNCFRIKLFSFKKYDKTVHLIVYTSKDTSNKHQNLDKKLYEQENRLYIWDNAW